MRRMSFKFLLGLLVAFVFIFSSCSKEGSAGETGAQGPAGPAGPQGPQGPEGDAGAANVIYSDWLDVDFEPADADTTAWIASIDAAQLTADIVNTGEIKVYLNLGTAADPLVVPLPYFGLNGILINTGFSPELISLAANLDGGTEVDGNNAKVWQYRYILIPGGVNTLSVPDVDWNDYASVKKYLHLKD